MKLLELWSPDFRPKSSCDTGIETLFALGAGEVAAGTAAAGLTAAEVGTAAATGFATGAGSALAGAAPAVAASSGILGTGLSLGELGTVASVAGTGLQVLAQGNQAAYEESVAKRNAEALRIKAGEETAAAQRRQIMEQRRAGLLTSRARALAADSGTLATSPTEVENEARIAGQGEYNALSSLYEGLAAARADNAQADIDLFRAGRIRAAAPLAQGATLLSGLTNFADRKARMKLFTSSGDRGFFGGF